MGRTNSIVFGKIQLHTDSATIDELKQHLADILAAHGYPEAGGDVEEKIKQLDTALEKALHAEASAELKQALAPEAEKEEDGSIVSDLEEPDDESVSEGPFAEEPKPQPSVAPWRKKRG